MTRPSWTRPWRSTASGSHTGTTAPDERAGVKTVAAMVGRRASPRLGNGSWLNTTRRTPPWASTYTEASAVNTPANFSRSGVLTGAGAVASGIAKGFVGGTAGISTTTGTGKSARTSQGFWAHAGALAIRVKTIRDRRMRSSYPFADSQEGPDPMST